MILGDTAGRLLTPAEGCGSTRARNTRMVGGSEARIGAWPWMALLVYEKEDKIFYDCGEKEFTNFLLSKSFCLKGRKIQVELKILNFRWIVNNVKTRPDCCSLFN